MKVEVKREARQMLEANGGDIEIDQKNRELDENQSEYSTRMVLIERRARVRSSHGRLS